MKTGPVRTVSELITAFVEFGNLDAEVYLMTAGHIEEIEDDLGECIYLYGDNDGATTDCPACVDLSAALKEISILTSRKGWRQAVKIAQRALLQHAQMNPKSLIEQQDQTSTTQEPK